MSAGVSLVTGGAGFVGRHLVAQLAARGDAVRVLDVAIPDAAFPPGVEALCGSILDRQALRRALAGAARVYHLAGLAQLWARDRALFDRVNHEGTRMVLQAAAAQGVERIVVTATEAILKDWRRDGPARIDEASPTPPIEGMAGAYCRSKYLADQAARSAAREGLPVVIVYPTVPVGPGDWNLTAPTRMIRSFLRHSPPAYLECRLNFVPVEDAAEGHILAAERGGPGERYILGGETLSLGEWLAVIARVSGRPMPKRRIPWWLAYASAQLAELAADHLTGRPPTVSLTGVKLARCGAAVDSGKARRELGWRAGPASAAVARAIAWLEESGLA